MQLESLLVLTLSLVAGIMFVLWLLSLLLKDASIVDIFWGLGFAVIAATTCLAAESSSTRKLLVTSLTAIWGLRLAAYLASRNLGKPEDYRYQAMRERFGDWFPLVSLFMVFGLQGAIMWVVSLPVQTAAYGLRPLGLLDGLGTLIWSLGLFFEAVGDFQMSRFKKDPRNAGQVMDRGLWRYTRHPNYFGDFLVWWGLYVMAISGGGAWTIVSPLLMTFLLRRVSGVALLERSLMARRAGYADYVRRTSAFFPLPPRGDRSPRAGQD